MKDFYKYIFQLKEEKNMAVKKPVKITKELYCTQCKKNFEGTQWSDKTNSCACPTCKTGKYAISTGHPLYKNVSQ